MGRTSFVYRGQRVSGLVDSGVDFGGIVSSPIHCEHERVCHGDLATVGNVPRKTRSFTAALEILARAGSFLCTGRSNADVTRVPPTEHEHKVYSEIGLVECVEIPV